MKAKLTLIQTVKVEIDGVEIPGTFEIKESWEGMTKLECSSPVSRVIVMGGARIENIYNRVPLLFGGNVKPGSPVQIELSVVSQDAVKNPPKS